MNLPQPALLIGTKLHLPPPRPHWVQRPELLRRLDAGVAHKLTLISAPAGYGKTTLASQWVANSGEVAAWLSLDPHDNDPTQFLRYCVAAIRTCVPEACPTTYSLLGVAEMPNVAYLTDSWVSELALLPSKLVFILDDYHHIRSPEVHDILRHLLRYLPVTLHLTLLTRFDPPLRLGSLRIAQQITEVRAGDLRFGPEETNLFFERRLARVMSSDRTGEMTSEKVYKMAETLHARTDGWIAGLELASISLQRQSLSDFLAHFRGSDRLLVGYLIEEVMVHLPEALQRFLLQIALVDRFCAPLADALVAGDSTLISGRAAIDQLEEMNLFVIALDKERYWYRFHDLFREFLRFQMQREWAPDDLACLHRRASAWFAKDGLIEDALRHALAGGDETGAADLIITHFHPMLDRQLPGPTLLRWIGLFPAATLQARPELLFAQVWLSAFGIGPVYPSAQLADLETSIQRAPNLSPVRRQGLLADLNALRAILTYWNGEAQRAIELLRCALEQQSPMHNFVRSQILIHLAAAYTCTGDIAAGCTLLRGTLAEEKAQQRPTVIILLSGLVILHLHKGALVEVVRIAQQAVATVDESGGHAGWQEIGFVSVWYAWAHYLIGIAYYEQNNLEDAAHHWQQVEALRYRTNPSVYHGSLLGLALIAQANGASGEALAHAQAARAFAAEIRRPNLLSSSDSFEVRLALRRGDTKNVERRTQEIETGPDQGMAFGVELPPLTRLRALLAVASPDALTEALAFSSICLQNAEDTHNILQTVQIGVLQALILHGLRRPEEAYDALARLLVLAEAGGFVRTFLDHGAPLAELLQEFAVRRETSAYLKTLHLTFVQEFGVDQQRDQTGEYIKLYGITPLTPREMEVLALISQRLSLAEIANTLVFSVSTAKSHTHNIYSKLRVRNGRQAVTIARKVGILPPE